MEFGDIARGLVVPCLEPCADAVVERDALRAKTLKSICGEFGIPMEIWLLVFIEMRWNVLQIQGVLGLSILSH